MKHLILLFLFIATSLSVYGQYELPADGRWEIGVDFLPLIDTTHFIKNSVLVRRVVSGKSKLRCRIGISFEEIRNRPYTIIPNQDLLSGKPFQSYLALGYERYLHVGKVSVFAGGDIFGTYYRQLEKAELDTRPFATPPTIYKISDLYHEYKFGLNLLIGVNIRLMPHLYLSTEAFLQIAYRQQVGQYRKYEGEALVLSITTEKIIKSWISDLQPVSAIHLIYKFNKIQP